MPTLMNCSHHDNGWCLVCVKKLQLDLIRERGTKLVDFKLAKSNRVIKIPAWDDEHGNEIICPIAHDIIQYEKRIDALCAIIDAKEKL